MITKRIRAELSYRLHPPRRVLFDHLPKCAGTTITKYLWSHYLRRLVFNTNGRDPLQSVREFQALPRESRFQFELVIGHATHSLLDFVHPDTIAVTILRDPIDRVVSHYFYVKQDKKHYLHDQVTRSNISLEDFASSPLSEEVQNWYTSHFAGLSVAEVDESPAEALQNALGVITGKYNIVGFQENLMDAVQDLRIAADLCQPFDNRVINKTRGRDDVREISEDARRAIAAVNSVDVKLFALLKERMF